MYEWFQSNFGLGDGLAQGLALVTSLVVVLVLFALFISILKRLTGNRLETSRNRQPRISVMDSASVDGRRRLVLVRRDNIEHLILIGGPSDVVVEQGIVRGAPLAAGQVRGQPAQAGVLGTYPIKSPVAPGPDLPVRPDELEPDLPPSPAGLQEEKPAPTNIAPPRPTPAPRPPAPAPAVAAMPAAQDPALLAEKSTPAAVHSATVRDFSKHKAAASLHKSAASGSQKPQAEPAAESVKPAEIDTARSVAPAVRIATADKVPVPDQPSSSRPSLLTASEPAAQSTPKSNPFLDRIRAVGSAQKITPPASGPAAKARTALTQPFGTRKDADRVEPVLSAAEADTVAIENDLSSEEADRSVTSSEITPPAATKAEQTIATDSKPPAKPNGNERVDPVKPDVQISADAGSAGQKQGDDADEEAAPQEKVGDALAKPIVATREMATKIAASDPAPEQADHEQADPAAGRNPIEDEMAKLLDEIHGTRK